MFKEEVVLTTFELMHTHGFIIIMMIMWGVALFVSLPIIYMLRKTSYKSKHSQKKRKN